MVAPPRTEITMSKMGKRLIAAARDARSIARGEANPKSYRVYVPTGLDGQRIRKKLGLSQTELASRNIPTPSPLTISHFRKKIGD